MIASVMNGNVKGYEPKTESTILPPQVKMQYLQI